MSTLNSLADGHACIVRFVVLNRRHHVFMRGIFCTVQLRGQYEESPGILRILNFSHDLGGHDFVLRLEIAGQLAVAVHWQL